MIKVFRSVVHKSKKERVCNECGGKIEIGEDYALDGFYNDPKEFCNKCFIIKDIEKKNIWEK